jgi:hypothetical protein
MRCLVLLMLSLTAASAVAAEAGAAPTVRAETEAVLADLGNGTVLRFLRDGDRLLGLHRVTVDGVELKSPRTVQRPLLAEEFAPSPMVWPGLRFTGAAVVDGRIEIACQLLGTSDPRATAGAFVMAPDTERALGDGLTPELAALKKRRDAAEQALDRAAATVAAVAKLRAEIDQLQTISEAGDTTAARQDADNKLGKRLPAYRKARAEALEPMIAQSPELQQAQRDLAAFAEELAQRASQLLSIHRDFYRHAILRQPEDACSVDGLRRHLGELGDALSPAGTLVWVIEPETRNIAGWTWKGWRQHYRFELPDGRTVNALRQLGTWELSGSMDGLTVVNLRYRGLGRIEQRFTSGSGGGVAQAFTTTEILPGAAGMAQAVSPAVPQAQGQSLADRGYALQHRVGAWIARMARGAGTGFVDFQYRPEAALASFFVRQGSLRAVTEAFPGDTCLSQTDEEFFPLTQRQTTTPQVILVLPSGGRPLQAYESRNRWQEVDQHVRDLVSEELGFIQFEPLPGIGLLFENNHAKNYTRMAQQDVAGWGKRGVRLIAIHNSGLLSGRDTGPGGPPKTGGGVNNIYDWKPTSDMVEPWKAFSAACAAQGIAYYPWWNAVAWKWAPFVEEIGFDMKHFSLNAPGDHHGCGWSDPRRVTNRPKLVLNPHSPTVLAAWLHRIEAARKQLGVQGFWLDSFQNNVNSHLDWSNGTGDSNQRLWWETFAKLSRDGIGLMSESHAFPGLSCSIEVADWEQDYWYFPHVWRWYRGKQAERHTPEELERLGFRVMANKGWTAPDGSPEKLPGFERMAQEYLAALPSMRRPYILADERGVLWLPFDGDGAGVLFAFTEQPLPAGVVATAILDAAEAPVGALAAQRTYRVRADDLLRAMSVRRGGQADPRLGRTYAPAAYARPAP